MALLDLPSYLRLKLQHPDNLNLMKDYAHNAAFTPKDGDIWRHVDWDQVNKLPEDSVAAEVR